MWNFNLKTFSWALLSTSDGTRCYSEKNFIIACLIWLKRCSYDCLWSTDVGCCKMCLDFFFCSIFLFWYFDITLLTILWWTISTHIWAESNLFDTYKNNRFWSPILILLIFQSYHSPHPVSTPKLFHSLSCFSHVPIPTVILFLSRSRFRSQSFLYPDSIAVLILSPSWFYCGSVQLRLHFSKIRKTYLV